MTTFVELPYPPSLNRLYRSKPDGKGVYKTQEGKNFVTAVKFLCHKTGIMHGPVVVHIDVCPPDKRKRDLDNLLKILLDALVDAELIDDDSCITRLTVQRRDVIRGGRVSVTIKPTETPDEAQAA